MKLHLFKLDRKKDVHDNTGVGDVALGIVVPSGKAIMWWNTPSSSLNIWDSLTQIEDIHGHGGTTKVKTITNPAELLTLFGFDAAELLKPKRKKKSNGTTSKKG